MMSAPSRAKRTACARPWPRAAPVTYATLPSRGWLDVGTTILSLEWLRRDARASLLHPCSAASGSRSIVTTQRQSRGHVNLFSAEALGRLTWGAVPSRTHGLNPTRHGRQRSHAI